MTVSCRRSAARLTAIDGGDGGDGGKGAATAAMACSANLLPHSPQNFAIGGLLAPQWEQGPGSRTPHAVQNFVPAR